MPDFYAEPYLHLAGLSHKSALITWGAFYFKTRENRPEFKLVDDSDLKDVFPPRQQSIGARSTPYGEALVTVRDLAGSIVAQRSTAVANGLWMTGLQPDTPYRYEVIVKGEAWAAGPRRDWVAERKGLALSREYDNTFRTLPDPARPAPGPVVFAVIGDFGAGVRKPGSKQKEVADALLATALERGVRFIVTTGDNIYAQRKLLGLPIGAQGDEDDDWFFTFYQPYRYLLNRMPVYPSIGNHDTGETEAHDDRDQLVDNLYLKERIEGDLAAGRASVGPGLFYRFRVGSGIELIALDTSKDSLLSTERLLLHPDHRHFLHEAFPRAEGAPMWRLPFGHHPPFCAGPQHKNTGDFARKIDIAGESCAVLDLFERAGVRVAFSGHEHNFQLSRRGSTLFVLSGGGAKVREGRPHKSDMAKAFTLAWAPECHFLLVTVDGSRMAIEPIAGLEGGRPRYVRAEAPDGTPVSFPVEVTLA
jgi:tartrate-resistant acid phosphatase type 5